MARAARSSVLLAEGTASARRGLGDLSVAASAGDGVAELVHDGDGWAGGLEDSRTGRRVRMGPCWPELLGLNELVAQFLGFRGAEGATQAWPHAGLLEFDVPTCRRDERGDDVIELVVVGV
jgi:hypothetical protein